MANPGGAGEARCVEFEGPGNSALLDLEAAKLEIAQAEVTPAEATKVVEENVEWLEEKHKGMRKQIERGLEQY